MLFPLNRAGDGPASPAAHKNAAGSGAPAATTSDAPPTPPPAAGVNRRSPIAAGDTVIVYESHTSMKAVTVSEEGTFSNRFGLFKVKVREWERRDFFALRIFRADLAVFSTSAPSSFITGLDRPALRRPCHLHRRHGLGLPPRPHPRALDARPAAPDPDPVCSGHCSRLFGARPRAGVRCAGMRHGFRLPDARLSPGGRTGRRCAHL